MARKKKARSGKKLPSKKKRDVERGVQRSPYSPTAIREFIQEVQAEFKKIVWPEKKITLGLSGFVILLTVILSFYLGSVDLLLGKLVSSVLK